MDQEMRDPADHLVLDSQMEATGADHHNGDINSVTVEPSIPQLQPSHEVLTNGTFATQDSIPPHLTERSGTEGVQFLSSMDIDLDRAGPTTKLDDDVDSIEDVTRSGLCYDARMRFHGVINPLDEHPEDPRRIYRIYRALEGAGLTSIATLTSGVTGLLRRIPAREARKDEVLLVHDLNHWESMLATADMTYDELIKLGSISDSVYFNNESAYCARLACGGAIETCKAVASGRLKNAIAVIRPPGHHAEPEAASGFCLFNNVAVAIKATMSTHVNINRVLILDWDVHHGNGTQTAFYNNPDVVLISIHRYENANFYPGSVYADLDKCGEGFGLGRNINVPWSTKGMGDSDYIHAFERVVMPIAREFDPDLVLISAGFDAAAGDPIGECFVTPAGYSHMTHLLMSLAGGKVVACLEGGYNLDSISVSALAVTKTLMGEAPPRLSNSEPSPRALETVHRVCLEQSKYWRCMAPLAFNHIPPVGGSTRLHDVVRSYQAQNLRSEFNMIPLPLLEDRASASFENQALSTTNFHTASTLIFYIHDAPEIWTNPSADQSRLSLHESYMPDTATMFLQWGISRGFGLIDINVPAILSGLQDNSSYGIQDETARLTKYIWDNYMELSDARHIIFLAIGESCPGIVNMLSVKDVTRRVRAVVNIYGKVPLRPLITVEDSLIDWYHSNSLCFTTSNNDCWSAPKKPKRKFGKAIRGTASNMDQLVHECFAKATEFILEQIDSYD